MTRAAWVPDGLDAEARKSLKRELDLVLPGSASEREEFLDQADSLLGQYQVLWQPFEDAAVRRHYRFERLKYAGYAFAKAIESLDDDDCDLIEAAQWGVGGKHGDLPHFDARAVAATARNIARAADYWMERNHKTTTGPAPGVAVPALISALAVAYDVIFNVRPSSSREGIFAKALNKILLAGGLEDVGETKIGNILTRTTLRGTKPRPGRRKQQPA